MAKVVDQVDNLATIEKKTVVDTERKFKNSLFLQCFLTTKFKKGIHICLK